MRYVFTAGSFPNLSYAELRSLVELFGFSPDSVKKFTEDILLVDDSDFTHDSAIRIFQRLGGFTRVGVEIENLDTFLEQFGDSNRVVYGVSVLNEKSDREDKKIIEKISKQIKKYYTQLDISARFILPKKYELNAAQVLKNQMIEKGFELVISKNRNNEQIYFQTLDIQNVDLFSELDMGRPSIDTDMGTLPPKLARIMVNLAQVEEGGIIWDPFCGSGTVLLESLLAGINVLGSDIDPKAIEYSQDNIDWLASKGFLQDVKYNLFEMDILNTNKKTLNEIKNTGIDAIVCEPYMGPPQKKYIKEGQAEELLEDVFNLYQGLFEAIDGIAHEGFRIVMVLPSYKTPSGWKSIPLNTIVDKGWDLENKKHGRDLKWFRDSSVICRNIFILTRK